MIEFDRVSLEYEVGQPVLQDLSFTIDKGSFQFLTGSSGAGKTTLLRLLLLSLSPSKGSIYYFEREASQLKHEALLALRRRIGVVFQDFRLLDHLTTFENVALPLRVQGRSYLDYKYDVEDLLEWVGLGKQMHDYPVTLSGGEKQRAAIARAVICKPEVLLADEPTGNVDPGLARRLLRLFVELNKLGTTVLIATHDFSLVEQTSARHFSLDNGKLQIGE